jgi:hypothetical protein
MGCCRAGRKTWIRLRSQRCSGRTPISCAYIPGGQIPGAAAKIFAPRGRMLPEQPPSSRRNPVEFPLFHPPDRSLPARISTDRIALIPDLPAPGRERGGSTRSGSSPGRHVGTSTRSLKRPSGFGLEIDPPAFMQRAAPSPARAVLLHCWDRVEPTVLRQPVGAPE